MRVLHVTHQYPPAIGGSERYIADLSEELAARGHQVDVFASRSLDFHTWKNELPGFERRDGVNVHRFRSLRRRRYVWRILEYGLYHYWRTRQRRYEPVIFFGGGPLSPGLFWAMLQRGRQYDVIHLNCLVYGHVAYGYWAARRLKVPVVVTPHAHAEQEVTYNIGYQREVLAGCDHVFAVTDIEREFLIDLGLPPERVGLSGNGLRPEHYPPGDTATARRQLGLPVDKPIVLFLGRKDKYKGLEVALQAFVQLLPRYPDLHFLAVGPETDDSRAMWPNYQGLSHLHNRGAVSDEEKRLALQACDFLALPSIGEAFGIVFLEAWIMGKPVIGARTLAVSTVIDDHRDGLLALPENAWDLARQMAYLIDHPERCRAMGCKGREKVLARYTIPRIADRVEGVYRRILEPKRGTTESVPESAVGPLPYRPVASGAKVVRAPVTNSKMEQVAMVDAIEIRDPGINQEDIRRRLREQIALRQNEGGYGPDPAQLGPAALRGVDNPPGQTAAAAHLFNIDHDLIELAANSSLREPQFTSSVPVLGGLIVAVRRAWNWMSTRWYVLPLIGQQNAINRKTAGVVGELARWVELNEQRLAELQARVEELEQRLARDEGH